MKALKEAAEYAAGVLARVAADGDGIGLGVTKPEMAVALRGLRRALEGVKPMHSDVPPVEDSAEVSPLARMTAELTRLRNRVGASDMERIDEVLLMANDHGEPRMGSPRSPKTET